MSTTIWTIESAQPEPVVVTRHRCPFCRRNWAHRTAAAQHVARCWWNPAARSCKTCALYVAANDHCNRSGCDGCGNDESCLAGVDLDTGLPVGCEAWEAAR